ncbi:iqgap- protein, partial [Dimargaris verticillata]
MLQAVDTISFLSDSPSKHKELAQPPASPDVAGLRGRFRLQRHTSQEKSPRYLRNGNWCDFERRKLQAYEYLCHIGEAKEWIEALIQEEIPPAEQLGETLRNGVILAKLAQVFDPEAVPRIFQAKKLQYRHSDNINGFLLAIKRAGLPKLFHFDAIDLYDGKNIPKVIYCIHALSHFLAQMDLAPHIKNLFGYLQFTDEQIAITQQELANVGYSIPVFKNVASAVTGNAEMGHTGAPQASEEGQAKLYWEKNIDIVIQFQACARRQLAKQEIASRRQAMDYTRLVDRVTRIQALARGLVARNSLRHERLVRYYSQHVPQVVACQALVRRFLAQQQLRYLQWQQQGYTQQVVRAQAQVRGFLARRQRKLLQQEQHDVRCIVKAQAIVRGALARRRLCNERSDAILNDRVRRIQALVRGKLERQRYEEMRRRFHRFLEGLVCAQSLIRGTLARRDFALQLLAHQRTEAQVVKCQAYVRGFLTRRMYQQLRTEHSEYIRRVCQLQALARGALARQKFCNHQRETARALQQVITTQAVARRWLARRRYRRRVAKCRQHEPAVTQLQALARGFLVRLNKQHRMEHFERHLAKIVQIQSMYRAKLAGKAFRTLSTEKNPPVNTMRSFVYLLDDSDQDFAEELELERLRQQVVRRTRDNHQTENVLNDLDIKIALLVKNRITLEELIKTSRYKFLDDYRYLAASGALSSSMSGNHSVLGGSMMSGTATGTWNSLYHLDKDSRRRLESYQHLFYLLQTQPIYLARLLFALNKGPLGEKNKKFMETVVLSLFGFAQNAREEFLLLKLFKTAIEEEIESIAGIHEFLRGNPVFIKLAVHHNRGAKERKYLRELLQPLVLQVIDDPALDLESDPLVIYRGLIREEESRTGMRSLRPYDISREEALNDMETRTTLIKHLQQLRTITDQFIEAILSSLDKMPYGIRYIARELQRALIQKFPHERENTVMKVVGHLVYYRYINPAIVAPDSFDVTESVINPLQRKNLAEIAKMLNQVSVGKLFSDDNMFLQPLNNYVAYTSERFAQYSYAVTNVMDPEAYFEIDEFTDLTQTRKPVIYMSPQEIFTMHQSLEDNLDVLAQMSDDPLRVILHDLGPAPTVRPELKTSQGHEIALTLTDRFADRNTKDHDSVINHLFVETKRYILYIIRVQSGKSLLDILEKPVSEWEEKRFREIIKREEARKAEQDSVGPGMTSMASSASTVTGGPQGEGSQSADPLQVSMASNHSGSTANHSNQFDASAMRSTLSRSSALNGLLDLSALTFSSLKKMTLLHMAKLESENRVLKADGYQAMLNSIAADIRNKHRRRVQRVHEVKKIRQTIVNLAERTSYLDDQKKTYLDYINS